MHEKRTSYPRSLPRTISYNATVKLSSELIGRLALFALVLIAARRLGESGFGLYNYALALGFVLTQLADLGMQLVITREIASEGQRTNEHTPARSLVVTALRLKLILAVAVAVLLLIILSRQASADKTSLYLLSLLPLLQSFPEFTGYVFRGRHNLRVEARLLAAARLTLAAVGAVVLLAGAGLRGLAVSQAVVGLGFAGLGLFLLRNEGWLSSWREFLDVHRLVDHRDQLRFLLRQSLPLGISIFLSIAYVRLAVLLIQRLLGETAVAHFSAAARLTEPLQIVPASIMAAVFPAITVALRQNSGTARRLGGRTTLLLFAAGVAIAAVGWFIAPVLIPLLYGADYIESTIVFQILVISLIPAFVNYSLTHYLVARGQQMLMGVFTGLMLALHAGLSWYLIPLIGPIGPALSIILAELLLTALCGFALWCSRPRLIHEPASSI